MAQSGSRYVALLRGINVGGKNVIAQGALAECFEELGFTNVTTYIQSGNVLFRSTESRRRQLTRDIELVLSQRFEYEAKAVVIPLGAYRRAVNSAPATWGIDDDFKHNAMFTLSGCSPRSILDRLPEPRAEIEHVATAPGVIFWSASKQHLTRTTLMKLARSPSYRQLTVRNHNTVNRLLELFETI